MSSAPNVAAPAWSRLAFAAFLLALLGYGGYFAYYLIAGFDVVNLHRDALIDDAFYYFEIARNFAAGKFSTFDGGITRTNGYHPVWLLLVTPLYWLFDLESALFGIKALEIMLIAGGVCLAALAVRLARLPWILLFAVLPALYCQRGMLIGVEAAAGLFFLGAFLYAAVLFAGDAARWRNMLAAIAFLLPWVRLEYVAISLLLTVALYFLPLATARQEAPGYFSVARLRMAGVPALAALAGLLAYFLYNGTVFGGIVPVSGAQKLAWSRQWFAIANGSPMEDLAVAYRTFLDTAAWDMIHVLELCVYALLAFGIGRASAWHRDSRLLLALLAFMLALGLETIAVKGQVALFYHGDVRRSTHWYYAPGYLMAALMVPVRCYMAIALWRLVARGRFQPAMRGGVLAICLVGIFFSFDRYSFTEPFRFVDESRSSHYLDDVWAPARGGVNFDAMLPKDAVIGSWDAGEMGYFTDLPVVNLDGLANSYDYLRMGGDVWDRWTKLGGVPAFGITHFVNHVKDDQVLNAEFEYIGHRIVLQSGYTLRLWPQPGNAGRSKPWTELVAASHGADGRENGYFELRHGRVMQIFLPSCDVEAVPVLFRFSWAGESAGSEGKNRNGSAIRSWPEPRRTALGYCTNTFLLPHAAAAATAIAVDGISVERYVLDATPLARGTYDLYAKDNHLIYVGDECQARAGSYRFLHIRPAARRDLALDRQIYGFANYDGRLQRMWRDVGGRCVAAVELPAYDIDHAWTGQEIDGQRTWQARIDGLALRPAAVDEFLAGAERIVAAGFQAYFHPERNKLLFIQAAVAPRRPCVPEVVFLHVHPRRASDLPAWQRQYGIAVYDFDFRQAGFVSAGRCAVGVQLPDYAISHVNIGTPGRRPHTWIF